MKIAVVISKYGLLGGAENFAFQLTERLAAREGIEIHVLANQWRRGNDSITFHKIPNVFFPRFMKPISFAYFAGKKIIAEDFDLVHSHSWIFEMDFFTIHGGLHEPFSMAVHHSCPERLLKFEVPKHIRKPEYKSNLTNMSNQGLVSTIN